MTERSDQVGYIDAHACSSYADGHRIHRVRAEKAFRDTDLGVGALVRVVAESIVELSWDGIELDFRCHDAEAVARAVDAGGDIGTWVPRWRVLILPGVDPRIPATFTLAAPDHWTDCEHARVLVPQGAAR